MSVTDVQRSIRQTRRLRVAAFFAAALNALMFAVNVTGNSLLALILVPFSAAAVIACLALIAWQTRMIGTFQRRERELSRRPRMTPEDYRRLREMEIELGWEPSNPAPETRQGEPPVPQLPAADAFEAFLSEQYTRTRASIIAPKPDLGNLQADLDRDMRDLAELEANSAGSPSAPMTGPGGRWHPVSELAGRDARAAEHFAALGRLGWLEDERRETEPAAASPELPADVYDRHFDGAGREWCRDGDGRCWIRPTPDSPWFLTRSGQ